MILFVLCGFYSFFFFFKQKTAYEMRISDWSSDVCSSDLDFGVNVSLGRRNPDFGNVVSVMGSVTLPIFAGRRQEPRIAAAEAQAAAALAERADALRELEAQFEADLAAWRSAARQWQRSEEHTSELQSLMRNSYAVFCLKKKINYTLHHRTINHTHTRYKHP